MKKRKRQTVAFLCVLAICFISNILPVSTGHSAIFAEDVSAEEAPVPWCYGDRLDSLSREIYDVMVQNYVVDRRTGDIETDFNIPPTFDATVEADKIVQDEAFETGYEQIKNAIGRASQAMVKDYPEVFWIASLESAWSIMPVPSEESSTGYKGTVTSYTLHPVAYPYAGTDKIGTFYDGVAAAKNAVEEKLFQDASDCDILKAIHDYLCEELEYNRDARLGGDEYQYAHNVYTAFAGDGTVACEGYAKAFKILCDEFGIPCILVTGYGVTDSSEAHMWNYVGMEDGKWYAVDVTWDDRDDGVYDTYFLAGTDALGLSGYTFSEEHVPDFNVEFPELADAPYEYDAENAKRLLAGMTAAEDALGALAVTAMTTEEDVIHAVQDAIGGGMDVTVENFQKTDVTGNGDGSITGTVILTLSETAIGAVSLSLEIASAKSDAARNGAAIVMGILVFLCMCAAVYSVTELRKDLLAAEKGVKRAKGALGTGKAEDIRSFVLRIPERLQKGKWKMAKNKEGKTNAMRILDRMKISYTTYTYECEEFVDALQIADMLQQPYEKVYKTLVTTGNSGSYFVFVIPIAEELDLKKAAQEVGEKSLSMLHVKELCDVTGYVRGGCTAIGMKKSYATRIDSSAEVLEHMIVSGGRIGTQVELAPIDLCRACDGAFADVTVK